MTIMSSGMNCDVCGNYIFGLTDEDKYYCFTVKGIEQELHSCKKCKKILFEADLINDWKKLPEGRLRKAFEEVNDNLSNEGKK